MRIETKISYEELSASVGAKRAQIGMLKERFCRKHGLLETSIEHCLAANEKKFTDYLPKRKRLGRFTRCEIILFKVVQ